MQSVQRPLHHHCVVVVAPLVEAQPDMAGCLGELANHEGIRV